MTTSIPPSITDYDNRGSLYVKEFSFNDACDKTRRLPLVVINRPTKVLIPSKDCNLPALRYTEWSSSAQIFRDGVGERGCLDHVISIRVAMSTGTLPLTVISNVKSFLDMFQVASEFSVKFGVL